MSLPLDLVWGQLLRTYIEILGINVAMLREIEVLLGHEHAFAEKVLVDLLAVCFWDKPCEKKMSVGPRSRVCVY
jgi:hypothetical protein